MDGLIVLGIFGAFAFLILSRLNQRRPESVKKLYDFFRGTKKDINLKDRMERIYPEKRRIM